MKYLATLVLVFGGAAMACHTEEKAYEVEEVGQTVSISLTGMT